MDPIIDMDIFTLFPIPVAKFVFDKQITKKQLSIVKKLDYIENKLNKISVNKHVLDIPEFNDLKLFFESCVCAYFKKVMCIPDNITPHITISWTNISKKAEGHHKHTHPNSILSGVFYLQSTEEDKIFFGRPETHKAIDLATPTEFTPLNSETWWLPASQNTLYVFPSSLSHFVELIDTDRTRISLSFNTFVTGVLGSDTEATTLVVS